MNKRITITLTGPQARLIKHCLIEEFNKRSYTRQRYEDLNFRLRILGLIDKELGETNIYA